MSEPLQLRLEYVLPLRPGAVAETEVVIADELSLFYEICMALDEQQACRFVVSGFGQESWPVDIGTDLCVVVEQLSGVLSALQTPAAEAELDFFEQGIERLLSFRAVSDDTIEIWCRSLTAWEPTPERVLMARKDLRASFERLCTDFVTVARAWCPHLTSHEVFVRVVESWGVARCSGSILSR